MSEIEKIKGYIDKHGAPRSLRYDMNIKQAMALAHEMGNLDAIFWAFNYGKAKGYRAAKAEAAHE